jgi:hypothetical protein
MSNAQRNLVKDFTALAKAISTESLIAQLEMARDLHKRHGINAAVIVIFENELKNRQGK